MTNWILISKLTETAEGIVYDQDYRRYRLPSGVAHTYMAAESLESAATAKGWQVKVETQAPSVLKMSCRQTMSPAPIS